MVANCPLVTDSVVKLRLELTVVPGRLLAMGSSHAGASLWTMKCEMMFLSLKESGWPCAAQNLSSSPDVRQWKLRSSTFGPG